MLCERSIFSFSFKISKLFVLVGSARKIQSVDGSLDDVQSRKVSAGSSNLNVSIRERLRSRVRKSSYNADVSSNHFRHLFYWIFVTLIV